MLFDEKAQAPNHTTDEKHHDEEADTLTAKKENEFGHIHAEKYSRKFRENIKPIIFIYLEMCFNLRNILNTTLISKLIWLVKKIFCSPSHEKEWTLWYRSTHRLSVPWPRTYDQKRWYFLSSQRKNIISEPFPKHAAFLSRYFNHEPCMNNAVLVNHDALHKKWRAADLSSWAHG